MSENLKALAGDLACALGVVDAVERVTLPLVGLAAVVLGGALVLTGTSLFGLPLGALGGLALVATLRRRQERGS